MIRATPDGNLLHNMLAFRSLKVTCGLSVLAGLLACTGFVPQPGQRQADIVRAWGDPTARYPLPAGALRLEYASGPYGRTTWMVDVDPAGQVLQTRQVLDEASFADFQQRAGGMPREELLRTLGRAGERRHGGYQSGEVWAWRYPTNDCLWFQVSLGDDGRVRDGSYGIDPRCDTGSGARD
jgi:hypothetical protein